MTAEGIRGGWRVKLYELENSGTWVDHGIGFAYIQLNSTFHGPALSVISESNPDQFLLQSKIQSEDLYEKQGETIILWKEADFSGNIDYALSFQEAEGCSFIWNAINEVQSEYMQQREYGSVPSFSRTQRVANSSSDHPSSSSSTGLNHDSNSASAFTVMDDVYNNSLYTILPTDFRAHESYLQQVKLKLESLHPSQRDYVAAQLLHEDCAYFKQLFRIFDELESKSQAKELVMLSEIFRFILLLNDPSIIEYLLSQDDVFRSVAGIFEYDKTLKERGQYRHFLFNTSQLREIIHLSEEVKVASKFLYRLKYVRDIMLHPTIDDPGITAINSMITFTSGEICSKVMNDESYMTELFSIIYPNVYQDLLLPQVQPALETSLLSPSSFEEANSRQKAPSKQPEGNTNQRFYQQLHQQQLDRLISFTPSSQGSRRRRKATIYSVEQLPDRFHGMLFLRELINLSKFMSYDRRVELYKSFFSKFKDVFMKVIMFVFHGATKALHYHIAPSPKPTNPLIIPSPTQVACSNSNITSPMNRQSSSDGLIEQKTVRSASSNTPLRQLSGLSSGNSKSSLNDENVNPDDSFEQETVKDNLTERQESCSQPSLSEEMEGVESSGEDQEWSAQLEWFCYEELYSHSQSLEALSHLADILSTIAFTFPSLIRQVILEGSHPPPSTAAPNASQSSKEKIERNGGQKTEDNRWIEKSLLFLLIDNIVNGKEITTIELFGETLKAVLDFDKQLNSVSLSANTTQGNGSNSLNPLHHQPHGQPSATMSNANAILLNQIKIEKEKFLPFFYDFYLTFLLAPYLDSNTPNQSIAPSFYENRGIFFVKQPAWSNKSLPAHSSPSNTGSGDLSSSQKPVRSVAFIRSSDPDNTSSSHSSSFFYETASKQSSFAIVTSRRLIIEVLTICILTHSYRIKYFLIKGNYVSKIISKSLPNQVERQQHKSVQLHAIKFLKCILMTRDDFYLRHFEKMDIFKPIIALLQVLPSKDNLVASSIYDVFEYIRNENMSLLIFYLVKKYGAVLDDLVIYPSVECFDKLKIKYLQLKEHEENPALFDEHQVNYRDSGGVNAELIKSATRERSSSSSSSSSSLNSNSGVTRGRKRHLLAQQSSLTNRSAIRRMLETDDEEDYFDNDEDEEEVVPLEEDPDFFSAPKNDGEEARREMGKEVETDVRDKSIGPVPATKRIRVLSPTSQLSDETHNNSDDMSVSSSSSPRFLETLKYKNSFPSKPLSPPHYSQRKHGSPLDGETQSPTYRPHASSSPITSLHIMSSNPPSGLAVGHVVKGKSAASTSGTSDDVFSLLSIYNDHEDLSTEKESGEEGLRSSAGGEDNDERESLEAVAATSDHSSQDNKNDIDDDFLPLAPLKSKFDSEDDEEVVAAVFSFNSNSTSVRPSGIGSGVMGSSLNKPKISVSIKSAGQSKTSE